MYSNDLMQLAQGQDRTAPPAQGQSLEEMLAKYEQRKALIEKAGLADTWVGRANEGVGTGLSAVRNAMPRAMSSPAGANLAAQAAQSGGKAAVAAGGAAAGGQAGANAGAQKAGMASSAAMAAGAAV